MLSNKDKEKPSRLSLGQLSRLQESTQRNADDLFGDIVNPEALARPPVPPPAPVFRAVTEEAAKEPSPAPPAAAALAVPDLRSISTPSNDPPVPESPATAGQGGEGPRPILASPKPARRGKPALKGEPCMAHPGESKRENLVSVRFTPEQIEDLEHWAEAERLPLAVLCRDLILKEMGRNRGLIQKIREFRQGLTRSSA